MPNLDTLAIKFSATGTQTAVRNIKDMGLAIRSLAANINSINASKLDAVATSMKQLRTAAPTKAQTERIIGFGNAVKGLGDTIANVNTTKATSFADSLNSIKSAVPTKLQNENLNNFGMVVGGMGTMLNGVDGSRLTILSTGLNVIKRSIPTPAQVERLSTFASAITDLSNAIGAANISDFSKDMATLGGAVESFKKSSVNSITNAVAAMQTMGQTATQTATAINNATPKSPSIPDMNSSKDTLTETREIIKSLEQVKVQANGITGILQKMGVYAPTKKFKALEDQAEKVRIKYEELRNALQKALNTGEFTSGSPEYKKKMAELDALRNKYDELILKQRELAREGQGFTLAPNLKQAASGAKESLSGLKKVFGSVSTSVRSANNLINSFTGKLRSLGKTSKSVKKDTTSLSDVARKLSNEFLRVSKMLKLMVTRMALRKVIAEVGEGFKSLAVHSDEFNNSVSNIMNAARQLGYSFSAMVSPLINALAPAIVYVINLLTKLANIFNQVISAITGSSTWNKAKNFTDSWRDSFEDTADSAKKAEKEIKKTVLGFDELNQLTDNMDKAADKNKGKRDSGIQDMFETMPIDKKWLDLANKIKNTAAKLFEPIKKAWEKVGDFVKKSWKRAMEEVFKLGASVARDFWEVWNQEKTQKIFENILKIIGIIGIIVGTLAQKFREAWDHNKTGLKILQNIRDIILIITNYILLMVAYTAKWAEELDFKPLLTKFNEWLESIKPVVAAFMGVIADFYTMVILPLVKWAIEDGGKQLLQVFIDFNNKVDWEALRKNLQELWEHVEPFMETVGEGLIIFIDRVAQKLADFINSGEFVNFLHSVEEWMDSVTAEDVADAIEKIVKFYLGIKIAGMLLSIFSKIAGVISVIGTGLAGILTLLKAILIVAEFLLTLDLTVWIASLFDPDTYGDYVHHPLILLYDTAVSLRDIIQMLIEDFKNLFSGDFWKGLAAIFDKIAIGEETFGFDSAGAVFQRIADAARETSEYANEMERSIISASDSAVTGFNNMADAADTANEGVGYITAGAANFHQSAKEIAEETRKVSSQVRDAKDNAGKLGKSISETSGKMNDMKSDGEKLADTVSNTSTTFDDLSTKIKDTKAASAYFNSLKGDISTDAQGITASVNGIDLTDVDKMIEKFTQENSLDFEQFSLDVDTYTNDIQKYLDELDFSDVTTEFDDFSKDSAMSMDDAKKAVDEGTKGITTDFDTISKAMTKDKWTFQGVADGLKETFKRAREAIKGEWNQIADTLNGEHTVGTEKIKIDLPKFARGGFVEDGLFLANHHELVGSFSNGRTAVANNEQIIQGISAGVYNAVSKANSQSGGSSRYISNTIVVDGETIARTVTKAQERQNMRYSPQMI